MTQAGGPRHPPGRSEPPESLEPGPGTPPARSWLARHPAWPVTALLAGIPLWWALGFGDYIFILLAIPMAARLYAWSAHGNRKIRVPPGFALWLLFLLVVLVGAATLSATAPGTAGQPGLEPDHLLRRPHRRATWASPSCCCSRATSPSGSYPGGGWPGCSGWSGLYTDRRRPGRRVLPAPALHRAARRDRPAPPVRPTTWSCRRSCIPASAQLQSVLGYARGRPDAPFAYTNNWGNCLALLLPWLIARWWCQGTRRQRLIALAAASWSRWCPSSTRWTAGCGSGSSSRSCTSGSAWRPRGRLAVLGGLVAALVIVAVMLIAATPLQGMISQRLRQRRQ